MRSLWLGLPALLLLPTLTAAQQPGPSSEQMLNAVLQNWEQAMTRLDSFAVSCRRTTTDKTFGGVDVFEGSAKFLKTPGGQPSRALLEMGSKKDPGKYEKFLYTGLYLYEWVPATKVLRIHDVPQPKNGQPGIEDNIVALLFGMKADDAKKRYQMTWVPDTKDNNKFYHYLQILPRSQADKADFTEARLVLTAKDFLPRQVWYHQPNGNEVTWDFENLKKNQEAGVGPTAFAPPQTLPAGWRVDRVQPQGAVPASGTQPKK
jgi:TIGR03009 family protein